MDSASTFRTLGRPAAEYQSGDGHPLTGDRGVAALSISAAGVIAEPVMTGQARTGAAYGCGEIPR